MPPRRFVAPTLLALGLALGARAVGGCVDRCPPAASKAASAGSARPADAGARPEVVIRPQRVDEAFDYLLYTLRRMPFFRQNGYAVALPEHEAFRALAAPDAGLDAIDEGALRALFAREEYREADFAAGLRALDGAGDVFARVFPRFASFAERWGFKVFPRYDVRLTLYGPGGSYDADQGTVTLFTTRDGTFKRARGVEVIVHEMVHIGIEDVVVRRFGLDHWEKEGLVDRVCALGLRDALPGYVVQSKGAEALDAFVTADALDDLPAAIARYTTAAARGAAHAGADAGP